jgi:hypothetical protein
MGGQEEASSLPSTEKLQEPTSQIYFSPTVLLEVKHEPAPYFLLIDKALVSFD